ncbi:MAG: hypothetical protein LC808_02815 [Actinobacteria bacterium]|nr:hypothetical protein [Actinomycetota bacterium]
MDADREVGPGDDGQLGGVCGSCRRIYRPDLEAVRPDGDPMSALRFGEMSSGFEQQWDTESRRLLDRLHQGVLTGARRENDRGSRGRGCHAHTRTSRTGPLHLDDIGDSLRHNPVVGLVTVDTERSRVLATTHDYSSGCRGLLGHRR